MTARIIQILQDKYDPALQFRDFFDMAADIACSLFLKHGDLKHVMYIAHDKQTTLSGFALIYQSEEDKDALGLGLRRIMTDINADFYVMASEAWTLRLPPGGKLVKPSTSPDRQEALIIEGRARDGDWSKTLIDITRDASGKPSLGARDTMSRDTDPEDKEAGRFGNLFLPDTPEEPRYGDTLH